MNYYITLHFLVHSVPCFLRWQCHINFFLLKHPVTSLSFSLQGDVLASSFTEKMKLRKQCPTAIYIYLPGLVTLCVFSLSITIDDLSFLLPKVTIQSYTKFHPCVHLQRHCSSYFPLYLMIPTIFDCIIKCSFSTRSFWPVIILIIPTKQL